ncbi:MAG: sigma-70 family RNA polymerase sigma factor [Deltaproteobacteria bacterium]|nr:sigma-70 family RNA polymerase sigma factor [Deltaproteobacteria bacterium]
MSMPPAPGRGTSSSSSPLGEFLAAWLGAPDEARQARVRERLDHIDAAVDEAWPDGRPIRSGFWAELARCVPQGVDDGGLAAALGRIHAADLYLAYACRLGDDAALSRFEREHVAGLGSAVARVDASAAFVDEIKQRIRTKLLVADGDGVPKIAHYTGQGELGTWVRVVAVREALSSVRVDRRLALVSDEQLIAIEASATGPELGALREQYREQFAEAFRDSLGELTPAQRNLLRLHYLHGLSIDELGSLLDIHRSSAARRIVKTRQDLLARTRRTLQARLEMGRQDFDQLMGLIASRLDLSIERFLAERDGTASAAAP